MLTQAQKRMIFQDTVIFTIGGAGASRIIPRVINGCYAGVTTSADDLAEVQRFLNETHYTVVTAVNKIVDRIRDISDENFPEDENPYAGPLQFLVAPHDAIWGS